MTTDNNTQMQFFSSQPMFDMMYFILRFILEMGRNIIYFKNILWHLSHQITEWHACNIVMQDVFQIIWLHNNFASLL